MAGTLPLGKFVRGHRDAAGDHADAVFCAFMSDLIRSASAGGDDRLPLFGPLDGPPISAAERGSPETVEALCAHAVPDDLLLPVSGLRFLVPADADQPGQGADASTQAGIAADRAEQGASGCAA